VSSVCCFERVIQFMLISVDRGLCLSRNVCSIIQMCSGPSSIQLRNVSDRQNIKETQDTYVSHYPEWLLKLYYSYNLS